VDYLIGKPKLGKGLCSLQGMGGFDDIYLFHRGAPLAAGFPPDVTFPMDKDYPSDIKTGDVLENLDSVLVVSGRFRELVEKDLVNNEFLPVTILNHKGRKEKGPFFILHQLVLQDCLDLTKTTYRENAINPEWFGAASNLVLDPKRIDPKVSLFRMARLPYPPVFRSDLVKKIEAAGLTGVKFLDPATYSY